ncbi:MAG: helix-turn-helix domain-containing protein [Candidatus Pacebacteria bacterium]|nr:helix-turn-helix domain-containing protein [Candidatus Paceibacterota bacterium]
MPATHSSKMCPVAKVAHLLSDSWTMLIIRDLLREPARFSELERSLAGVSSRTLTLKLKKLVDEGIVAKDGLLYSITKPGEHLRDVISAMEKCGKGYK